MKFSEIGVNEKFSTLAGQYVKLTENSYAGIHLGDFIYSEKPITDMMMVIPFGQATLLESDLILHCLSLQKTIDSMYEQEAGENV